MKDLIEKLIDVKSNDVLHSLIWAPVVTLAIVFIFIATMYCTYKEKE